MEGHRLMAFRIGCLVEQIEGTLKGHSRLKGRKKLAQNQITRSFKHFTSRQILSRWTGKMMGWGTYREKRETCTGFWWENRTEGDHLQDLGAYGKKILKPILKKFDRRGVDLGTSGREAFLRTRKWIFGLHKTQGISWFAFSRRTQPNGDSNTSLKYVLGHAYIIISIILKFHMSQQRDNIHTGIHLVLFDTAVVLVSFADPYSTSYSPISPVPVAARSNA
jgi:hypothetical protein